MRQYGLVILPQAPFRPVIAAQQHIAIPYIEVPANGAFGNRQQKVYIDLPRMAPDSFPSFVRDNYSVPAGDRIHF